MPGEAAVRRSRGRAGQRTESSARCLPDVRNQDEPDSRKEIVRTKQPSHSGTGRHAVRTEPAHRGSHRTRRQAFQLLLTASHAGATLAPRPAPASGVLAQPAIWLVIWSSGHLVNRPTSQEPCSRAARCRSDTGLSTPFLSESFNAAHVWSNASKSAPSRRPHSLTTTRSPPMVATSPWRAAAP
jgi:hypothetical protein